MLPTPPVLFPSRCWVSLQSGGEGGEVCTVYALQESRRKPLSPGAPHVWMLRMLCTHATGLDLSAEPLVLRRHAWGGIGGGAPPPLVLVRLGCSSEEAPALPCWKGAH